MLDRVKRSRIKELKVVLARGVEMFDLPGPFPKLSDLEQAQQQIHHYFFARHSIRFFSSRPTEMIRGRFFIDSTRYNFETRRTYRVMLARDSGVVEPVRFGTREAFDSLVDARRALAKLLRNAKEVSG